MPTTPTHLMMLRHQWRPGVEEWAYTVPGCGRRVCIDYAQDVYIVQQTGDTGAVHCDEHGSWAYFNDEAQPHDEMDLWRDALEGSDYGI